MEEAYILLLALFIDLVLGDPPTAFHPVGWMGKLISFLERFAPGEGPKARFLYGIALALITLTLFSLPSYLLLTYLKEFNLLAFILAGAVLLKLSFSIKGLGCAALKVKRLLENENLEEARVEVKALVSRETKKLNKPLLVSAVIESVGENTCDSFVAPLFYFLFIGVPGAIAYRAVNTLDAMIGYHGRYEYLGKFSARLDDALNFIPARLTGFMFVLASLIFGRGVFPAFKTMLHHHAKTESPNAGWTMAAVAGALGVELEKVGHYKLGKANSLLEPAKVDQALGLMWLVALIWVSLCFAVKGWLL